MGAIFAERVVGMPTPRVALLSIGEEKGKGDARIQRGDRAARRVRPRFVGNVEGKDLVADLADVVVTDAVAGNVVIKFFEGLSTFIFDLWRAEFRRRLRGRLAYLLLRPGIGRIRKVFDYERAGGSPLLGVKGAVIITHGRARRRMVGFARAVAADRPETGVPELIAEALRDESTGRRGRLGRRGRRRGVAERRARPTSAPAPDVPGGRGRIARPEAADLSVGPGRRSSRSPGCRAGGPRGPPGRSPRGPRWRAALAGAADHGPRPAGASTSASDHRPARRALAPLGPPGPRGGRRAVERLLGLEVRAVTVLVDGVGS